MAVAPSDAGSKWLGLNVTNIKHDRVRDYCAGFGMGAVGISNRHVPPI